MKRRSYSHSKRVKSHWRNKIKRDPMGWDSSYAEEIRQKYFSKHHKMPPYPLS